MGGSSVKLPLISWFFIIAFKLSYLHIIRSDTHAYTKNGSDNLGKSYTIHEMYECQCMLLKEANIFVSMIIVSIVEDLINTSTWKKRKKD